MISLIIENMPSNIDYELVCNRLYEAIYAFKNQFIENRKLVAEKTDVPQGPGTYSQGIIDALDYAIGCMDSILNLGNDNK